MIPKRAIYKPPFVKFLDQRLLPDKIFYIKSKNALQTAKAIKDMVLRGAPLIGCGAAYGYAIDLRYKKPVSWPALLRQTKKAADILKKARPTALALFYAVDRMHKVTLNFIEKNRTKPFDKIIYAKLLKTIESEAQKITKEDIDSTVVMSNYGEKLLKKNSIVITHCNAGALATMGMGTSVGVITTAQKKGKIKYAYACETRPYLQGSRLTIWELMREKVPSALICDNMAAHIIKTCKVNAIIVGADRIAANGDTANKIGTYSLGILAKHHKIPFYVIAPIPTIDLKLKTGKEIKIEERGEEEVIFIKKKRIAPKGVKVRHPAFDITPASLITALITEKGIIKPVNSKNIKKNLK
ncbi:MAG: S-methyl-5-thioribose-1-phosphate isomerase [Elusimicrobiota bacterium]|nr:S-methyl-5-thioribose-1-phosphate isomerase [Elusimicrobiota bacterium]